jgi:hypothetical protein
MFTRKDFGPIITVLVGEGEAQQKFEIHKGLLIHYSAYFRKALKDSWAEGMDKTVKLPGEYEDAFEIFYHWVYTRIMYTPTDEGEIPLGFRSIVKSYVFGDAHQIPEFCNAAINTLSQKCSQAGGDFDYSNYAYENTLPGSMLRIYFTHEAVACWDWEPYLEDSDNHLSSFLADAIAEARERGCAPGGRLESDEWDAEILETICNYHDHSSP